MLNQTINLKIIITNYQINLESLDNDQIIKKYIENDLIFQLQPNKIQKYIEIGLTQNDINVDQSRIPLVSGNTISVPVIERQHLKEFSLINNEFDNKDGYIANIKIQRSPISQIQGKSLQKIDDSLSKVGGFINCIFLIVGLLASLYNQLNLEFVLINRLYQFDEKEVKGSQYKSGDKKIINNDFQQPIPLKKIKEAINIAKQEKNKNGKTPEQVFEDLLGFVSKRDFLTKQIRRFLNKKFKLPMTFSYILYKLTFQYFFKTKQNMLIEKALNQMDKDMDIQKILKKLQEIDKLKELVFDSEQIALYQFTPKPVISLKHDRKRRNGILTPVPNYKKLGEYINIFYAYHKVNSTRAQDKINNRLITSLGELSMILENSKTIMLNDDIRFLTLKRKVKKGMLENLRKYRKKIRQIWNKFARYFLMKYSKKQNKKTIWLKKDFHYSLNRGFITSTKQTKAQKQKINEQQKNQEQIIQEKNKLKLMKRRQSEMTQLQQIEKKHSQFIKRYSSSLNQNQDQGSPIKTNLKKIEEVNEINENLLQQQQGNATDKAINYDHDEESIILFPSSELSQKNDSDEDSKTPRQESQKNLKNNIQKKSANYKI